MDNAESRIMMWILSLGTIAVIYAFYPQIIDFLTSTLFKQRYKEGRAIIDGVDDSTEAGQEIMMYYQYDRSGRMGGGGA